MKILAVLLTLAIAALPLSALPLTQYESSNFQSQDIEEINEDVDINNNVASESFDVQIDRFAQLVSTHWQFDHLETVISASYGQIASKMKNHVNIVMHSSPKQQQQTFAAATIPSTLDLDLLKAQISGAIQAHTEGNLPTAWDQLGDRLSRPAFEAYVKQLVLQRCSGTGRSEDTISLHCLNSYSSQILSQIDRYVSRHLAHAFDVMNAEFLPDLLHHTTEDLHQVLTYFNEEFLSKDNLALTLEVTPWQQNQQELRTQLLRLAALSTNNADHVPDIVAKYAQLARV